MKINMKDNTPWIKVEEIKPHPNNPNEHPPEQLQKIATNIDKLGWGRPILISNDYYILAGHGAYMAATEVLSLKEVPYRLVDYVHDSPEAISLMLSDNKLAEESYINNDKLQFNIEQVQLKGFDTTLTGFDNIELQTLDEKVNPVEIVEDDFTEEVEPNAKLGQIWKLGNHRLMCGDSTSKENVTLLMDGNLADMVFTDPLYNVNYTGGLQFKSNGMVEHNNREMIKNDDNDIYEDVFKILSQFCNGPCYIWFAGTKAKSLYSGAEKYGDLHSLIIWVKNGGYGALNSNYKQKHEPCLYWKPKGAKLNFIGTTTETTIWEINKDGVNNYHPTQKPISLSAKAILNHDAMTVLDLFGGSGSTLIACEQTNRQCYMMELDPHYCDVIIKRWEDFTQEKAELIL